MSPDANHEAKGDVTGSHIFATGLMTIPGTVIPREPDRVLDAESSCKQEGGDIKFNSFLPGRSVARHRDKGKEYGIERRHYDHRYRNRVCREQFAPWRRRPPRTRLI